MSGSDYKWTPRPLLMGTFMNLGPKPPPPLPKGQTELAHAHVDGILDEIASAWDWKERVDESNVKHKAEAALKALRSAKEDWGTVCLVAGEMLNMSMHDIDAEYIYGWANRLLMLAENNIDEMPKTEGGAE